jgi:cullin 1
MSPLWTHYMTEFTDYLSFSSGRKLTWLWNYSKNELRTNYLNQKYILLTSAYQTAVLVQYNHSETLSLDELVTATALPKDTLTQILAVLVKAKILLNDEPEQYDLNPSAYSVRIEDNNDVLTRARRLQIEENTRQP